jgi:hypothetical protein
MREGATRQLLFEIWVSTDVVGTLCRGWGSQEGAPPPHIACRRGRTRLVVGSHHLVTDATELGEQLALLLATLPSSSLLCLSFAFRYDPVDRKDTFDGIRYIGDDVNPPPLGEGEGATVSPACTCGWRGRGRVRSCSSAG